MCMKLRVGWILALSLVTALARAACGEGAQTPADSGDGGLAAAPAAQPAAEEQQPDIPADVDITEKMYVTWINEIYTNTRKYIGRVIRLEGMFSAFSDPATNKTYYYVYRTGPGCCGNDGSMCGFEFTWSGTPPAENDWIEVTGPLSTYEEGGNTYLTLNAQAVRVKSERGKEVVFQ